MSVIPGSRVAKIEFCEQRLALWALNAVPMGSTAPAVSAWTAKVEAARAAYLAQKELQDNAKSATNTFNLALQAMTDATADIVKQVKTAAALNGDAIYSLANIPAPATPTTVGAPGTPFGFKVTLMPNGSLQFNWNCNNPAGCDGVIYQVARKVTGVDAEFTYLGGAGQREFTDVTVPTGVASLTYSIQGTRSTAIGVAQEFVVNLGTTGMTVTPTITTVGPKIAA